MTGRLSVRVEATEAVRAALLTKLRHADVAIVPAAALVVAAARTVDEALELCARAAVGGRLLIVADGFTAGEAARAVRAGVGGLLQSAQATPARLADTLRSLRDGDGRLPHELLVRLLAGGVAGPSSPPVLTQRQLAVLRLMADGLGNVSIARSLSCSGHTVKNVVYELMTRLDARNRAHAVAAAVRSGLI